jgi:predicted O-methyltransferase YrrM
VFPRIESYLENLETTQDAILADMERQATEQDFPIVGPLVGRTLCLLSRSIGARRILELGSGFGYSGYWFARGLPDDGELILTDTSSQRIGQAREFFGRGSVGCRVRFEVGDGLEILDRLPGEFDVIFNDVHKEQYPVVFQKAVPRLRVGGYFICDNMLWGGRVVDDAAHPSTRGVLELTKLLFQARDLYTAILPMRDGVSVSLKLR